MNPSLILAFYFFLQGEIPFKNSEEFQVQVDLKFKINDTEYKPNTYTGDGDRMGSRGTNEPFLLINITHLKILNDEVKMKAIGPRERSIFKRKCSPDDIHFEIGFLSDLKKGLGLNQITIVFLSSEKMELRKIELLVLKDGTFLVNGKQHGKF